MGVKVPFCQVPSDEGGPAKNKDSHWMEFRASLGPAQRSSQEQHGNTTENLEGGISEPGDGDIVGLISLCHSPSSIPFSHGPFSGLCSGICRPSTQGPSEVTPAIHQRTNVPDVALWSLNGLLSREHGSTGTVRGCTPESDPFGASTVPPHHRRRIWDAHAHLAATPTWSSVRIRSCRIKPRVEVDG